jgi:Tfp pilus assembly protein PilX
MEHTKLALRHLGKKNSGVALILVLMLVVLTSVLMLAFFLSVQTESKSVRSVSAGQNSQQLADLAVQSVIATIQQATTRGTTNSWAYQTGMIRCYDATGTSAIAWYKLYSSGASPTNLVTSPIETFTAVTNDVPTAAWTQGAANYGVYTDINSPVASAVDGTLTYPIVNPAGATSIVAANNAANHTTTTPVIGFDINTAQTPGYNAAYSPSATNNQAAMPVRWLYVLRNGAMVPAAASATPGTVTVSGASSANPIVGRVAYWTDDETCKVNVNTAADGTYFDSPRFASVDADGDPDQAAMPTNPTLLTAQVITDRQMGETPPVVNEYQRYIGHPAQTRLTYALNGLSGISSLDPIDRSHLLTDITPFLQWGGSAGGTVTYNTTQTSGNSPMLPPTRQTPYATLDEWMFHTQLNNLLRIGNPGNPGGNPPPSPITSPLITNAALQQLRFFLSSDSDAPEVSLFGQPRVSIWPIPTSNLNTGSIVSATSGYASTYDQMIARAASLTPSTGGNALATYNYSFSRMNAGSSTIDVLGQPGATGPTRNLQLLSYLRAMASTPIPGSGGIFGAPVTAGSLSVGVLNNKYGTPEMDQILTEIFDYVRSTNSSDLLLTSTNTFAGTAVSGTGTPYEASSQGPPATGTLPGPWGTGQVTPIILDGTNFLGTSGGNYLTKGFGRFYTVSNIAIDFTQWAAPDPVTKNIPIVGSLFVGLFSPSLGYGMIDPHLRIVVQDANSFIEKVPGTIGLTLNGTQIFPTPDNGDYPNKRTVYSVIPQIPNYDLLDNNNGSPYQVFAWGAGDGIRHEVANKGSPYVLTGGSSGSAGPPVVAATSYNIVPQGGSTYQLSGMPMMIAPGSTLKFNGGALEILVYFTNSSSVDSKLGDGFPGNPSNGLPNDLIQDLIVTLPPFSLPLPTNGTNDFNHRLYNCWGSDNYGNATAIQSGDVIQSLVAGYNGDTRLVAAQPFINDSIAAATGSYNGFVPHQYYNQPTKQKSNSSMATSMPDPFLGDGFHEDGVTPGGTGFLSIPAVPPSYSTGAINFNGTIGAPDFTGDWDNGLSVVMDGPYINKADEAGSQYAQHPYYGGVSGGGGPIFSSPNRTLASPVVFGSLSTGVPIYSPPLNQASATVTPALVSQVVPWQTLLFRPQPAHPQSFNPEDELLLDWFWMPVVEPYAISNTFDTAGKVNMNYQIAPFTYITRATALMSVLGSEYVIAVPNNSASVYKAGDVGTPEFPPYRSPVKVLKTDGVTMDDDDGTLRQFKDRFNNGLIFSSAAQICDIYLEPTVDPSTYSYTGGVVKPATAASWGPQGYAIGAGNDDTSYLSDAQAFWAKCQLTGDNSRERPYNGLYPRLTTKSNTYTVHVRAQTLAGPTGAGGTWVENPQNVTSEYRGSVTINRYLDPEDPNWLNHDFANPSSYAGPGTNPFLYSMDNYYKYRIVETRRFLP